MALTIKMRQGLKANLPTTGITVGEPLWCTNTQELYAGTGATTKAPVNIDLVALDAIGQIADEDKLYMYDVSELGTSVRGRSCSFVDFKTALNIPPGSTDEKVAVAAGATADYLGATDNAGVLQAGIGIKKTAGAANAYISLGIGFTGEGQGHIAYRGAATWATLAPHATIGALLQSGGTSGNPSYTTTIDGGTF